MARNTELQVLKEQKIIERYQVLCKTLHQWKNDAIIKKVANEFYLSERTIYAVVSGEYARKREKSKIQNPLQTPILQNSNKDRQTGILSNTLHISQ
jgi:hypothetical protein